TGSMTTGSMTTAALVLFTLWCAVLAAVDLRVRRLPNALTGAGALAVFGYALAIGRPWPAVVGALLLASPYLALHLAAPAACGAGDAKLAVAVGAAAGLGGAQAWVTASPGAPVPPAAPGPTIHARERSRPEGRGPPWSAHCCWRRATWRCIWRPRRRAAPVTPSWRWRSARPPGWAGRRPG